MEMWINQKMNEFLDKFQQYEINKHLNDNNKWEVVFINASNYLSTLSVCFDNQFILNIGGVSVVYKNADDGYQKLVSDIKNIIAQKMSVASLFVNDVCYKSLMLEEEINHFYRPQQLLEKFNLDEDEKEFLNQKKVKINVAAWSNADCYDFYMYDIIKGMNYRFVRRQTVFFVIKDGICYGSGSIKKYNDEIAYLSYLIIDDVEAQKELEVLLVRELEKYAKALKFTSIFCNITSGYNDLFMSQGYQKIALIQDERVIELDGCYIVDYECSVYKDLVHKKDNE